MKKNGFFTFCFSFIPGAGQMYQTYMKRGLSILIIFSLFVILAMLLGAPIFIVPCLIVFAYSFFDTFNIRNSIGTDKQISDEYIWGNTGLDSSINTILSKKSFLIGISLLCIGIYLLVTNVIHGVAYRFHVDWLIMFAEYIKHYLPSIIIASLSIGVGIKLMFNKKG